MISGIHVTNFFHSISNCCIFSRCLGSSSGLSGGSGNSCSCSGGVFRIGLCRGNDNPKGCSFGGNSDIIGSFSRNRLCGNFLNSVCGSSSSIGNIGGSFCCSRDTVLWSSSSNIRSSIRWKYVTVRSSSRSRRCLVRSWFVVCSGCSCSCCPFGFRTFKLIGFCDRSNNVIYDDIISCFLISSNVHFRFHYYVNYQITSQFSCILHYGNIMEK